MRAAAIAAAIVTGLVVLLLFALFTPLGNTVVAGMVEPLTGGSVAVSGLGGALPDHPRAAVVELRDANGTWLRLENVRADMRMLALFDNHIDIAHAEAEKIVFLRPQVPSEESSAALRIDVADARVARIELSPAVIGRQAALAVSGSVHYASRRDVSADIAARRLDGEGTYRLHAAIRDGALAGTATIAETGDGIAGGAAGLPDIGAVSLEASAHNRGSSDSIAIELRAGSLRASGQGTIDLARRRADVAFFVTAPAMRPRRDLSWSALEAHGVFDGPFDRPHIEAALSILDPDAAGLSATRVDLKMRADGSTATVSGVVGQLEIPARRRDLLAGAPVKFAATVGLATSTRPIDFTLDHPLIHLKGRSTTLGPARATVAVDLPKLGALAALTDMPLDGRADFQLSAAEEDAKTAMTATGSIAPAGPGPLARMLGRRADLYVTAALAGSQIVSARGALQAQFAAVHVAGATTAGRMDYRWDMSVSDASKLAATIAGRVDLAGRLDGIPGKLELAGTGSARLGIGQGAKEKLNVTLSAGGLPDARTGAFGIFGRFGGAPMTVAGRMSRGNKNDVSVTLDRAQWKSLLAKGAISFAGGPQGAATVHVGALDELDALLGTTIRGALDVEAGLRTQRGATVATLRGTAKSLSMDDASVGGLRIGGTIASPFDKPQLFVTMDATDIRAADFSGKGVLHADGPTENLKLDVKADGRAGGDPVALAANAMANTRTKTLRLQTLRGEWREQTFALDSPAVFDLAGGIAVDRLHAEFAGGDVVATGRILPRLALEASAKGSVADALKPFAPDAELEGAYTASASLAGTMQAPAGTIDLRVQGLRLRGTSQRGVPPTAINAHGTIRDSAVALQARLTGGSALNLSVTGELPLQSRHAMRLRAQGTADLAPIGAILSATGKSLSGKVSLDASLEGTFVQPRIDGTVEVIGAEYRDYLRGIRVHDIEAAAEAKNGMLRITRFTAKADPGTITGTGTIDLDGPGVPVDLAFDARNARPVASDLLTATVDSHLKLQGRLAGGATLRGTIEVRQGEIKIPERFPRDVAVLNVRRRGQAPPVAVNRVVALDLNLTVPGRMFVSGRGIDAEMGGDLRITGTNDQPLVMGALDMRRGTLSLAGRTLEFQSGTATFDGFGLRNRLDPLLDFTAQSSSGGTTATLKVTGYASAPLLQLTSSPSLEQDEILAQLLFQQSVKQLSPLQLAEIAAAVAALSGVGSGFDPVGRLRRSLGLDRLAVGTTTAAGSQSSTTTVEVGKYVTRNIYVGAKQDFAGTTRAVVEVDITKNLKAQASVAAGTRATATTSPLTDNGDSAGISYQFEY